MSTTIVFNTLRDAAQRPRPNVRVVAYLALSAGFDLSDLSETSEPVTVYTDDDGYWEVPLKPNDELNLGSYYIIYEDGVTPTWKVKVPVSDEPVWMMTVLAVNPMDPKFRYLPGPQGRPGFQGDPGYGERGPQGSQGVQGSLGNQGAQGIQGAGFQGVQGLRGFQGFQGFQGQAIQGPQGTQGQTGTQGSQGVQGQAIQGPQGNQGFQGLTGPQGSQGNQGFTGVQGSQGQTGTQGSQGVQGQAIQGPQGTQGDRGLQGTQGQTGNQGFQGAGPQGPIGNQGQQGNQGVQGTQGEQGQRGTQGLTGSQGLQGTQGNQGRVGVNWRDFWDGGVEYAVDDGVFYGGGSYRRVIAGTTPTAPDVDGTNWYPIAKRNTTPGPQGSQGAQGSQGQTGTGSQGPQGSGGQGPQGNQGSQGAQGSQGSSGTQGTQGNQGPRGLQGFQGSQGANGTGTQGTQGPQGVNGPNYRVNYQPFAAYDSNDLVSYDNSSYIATQLNSAGNPPTGTSDGSTATPNPDPTATNAGWRVFALRGTQGIQGATGAGTQGAQGSNGLQGAQGANGTQGTNGVQGSQGFQGTNGTQGTQGTQGNNGTQGFQGAQGSQGSQGVQGLQGGLNALPANVPNTVLGPWNPSRSGYNFRPTNLHFARAQAAKAGAGTRTFECLAIGDSGFIGYNGSTYDTNFAIPRTFGQSLSALLGGIPFVDGHKLLVAAASVALQPEVVVTGSWVVTDNFIYSNNSSAFVTIRALDAGTVVEFTFSNVSGNFTYSIDDEAPVSVTTTGAVSVGKVTRTGLANTTHKLVINGSASTYTVPLSYCVWNPALNGIRVHNLALGGSRAATDPTGQNLSNTTLSSTVTGYGGLVQAIMTTIGIVPDLGLINTGGNDISSSTPAATIAQGAKMARTLFPNTSFIYTHGYKALADGTPAGSLAIFNELTGRMFTDVCDVLGMPMFDWNDYVGGRAGLSADGGIGPDGTHPTDAHKTAIGRVIATLFYDSTTPNKVGAQGPQGFQGSQGNQGFQGQTGSGAQGVQGTQGSTGTGVFNPSFTYPGSLSLYTGQGRFYNDSGRTLTFQSLRASVGTAPTGATIIIDVKKNGTTIYTTSANRPTIAASAFAIKSTNPDVTTMADGDYLTIDIVQIGSTVSGSDLNVQVLMV